VTDDIEDVDLYTDMDMLHVKRITVSFTYIVIIDDIIEYGANLHGFV
jgi:hypothetical protein